MAPLLEASRIRGSLLGLAVGDALGAPYERAAPTEAKRAVETGTIAMEGGHGWEPGEWTDDTAMALLIAESIAERGLFDTADVARRYIDWAESAPKGMGAITRAALIGARDDEDARARAKTCHDQSGLTAGNGTVMRVAPVALAASSAQDATHAAREDARLTHFDPAAANASAAFCAALLSVADGGDPVAAAEGEIRDHPRLTQVVGAVRAGHEEPIQTVAGSPEAGTCWATLGVALFALTKFDDYEEAVLWAISLGGDTDTNAAVTGALLGSRTGPDAIPDRWLEPLHDRERIERAADALARG